MIVSSCRVTYLFQSESTLYSCLNVKELLAWSRYEIWSLSDCNWIWTQNHLVRKWTLDHLPNCSNDWAVLWVLICTMHLTVCSLHVRYTFQSESTLYSNFNFRFRACFEQGVLDIQATIECGFTLTRVRDMRWIYSQMHRTDKYSEHSSIIWPVGQMVEYPFTD